MRLLLLASWENAKKSIQISTEATPHQDNDDVPRCDGAASTTSSVRVNTKQVNMRSESTLSTSQTRWCLKIRCQHGIYQTRSKKSVDVISLNSKAFQRARFDGDTAQSMSTSLTTCDHRLPSFQIVDDAEQLLEDIFALKMLGGRVLHISTSTLRCNKVENSPPQKRYSRHRQY